MILYNPTVSGSLVVTGSLTTTGTITSQTLVVQTITSSIEFNTGSTRNGTLSTNTHEFTGSVLMTGSLSVTTTGTELQVNASGVNIGNALTDNHIISGSLRINPNGLFVSSSGDVGIGTITPRISASGTNRTLDIKGGIYFGDSGAESCTINNDDSMIFNIDANNNGTTNFFRWATNTKLENGGTELMRLTEAGLLGIGTSSPDYALTISGSTDATSGIRIKNTDGITSNARIIIEQNNGQKMNMYSAGNGFTFNYSLTGGVSFYDAVNSANRLSISGDGNLGLGVTPFTNTLSKGFDLVGGGGIFSVGNDFYIHSNAYFNTEWRYKATAGVSGIKMGSDGTISFNTAASGTINTNVAGLSAKMQITSAGNCYLGDGFNSNNHRINKKVAQGSAILVVSAFDSVGNDTAIFSAVNGASGNGAGTALMLPRNDSTNRSINAGGTINASGADYAEYMTKSVNDIINKGDIVGVDINGKLTNIFANSISFVIKSTDPSYVGGDVWGNEDIIGKKPLKTENQSEEEFTIINEAFEIKLEEARAKVDRISFSGQVPCNVLGANVGDYIIPIQTEDGKITGQAVASPSFEQYQISVGKVWKIMEDGRAWIAVKIG
jgi:hypothetical protein